MFNNFSYKDDHMQNKIDNKVDINEKTITYSANNDLYDSDEPENPENKRTNYYAKKRISLYKTEMCRSYEETGICKYGDRCQFAHARNEVRGIERHPRYKTETCKTFWEEGTCPYGKRCCFIHLEQNLKNRSYKESIKEDDDSESLMKDDILNDDLICSQIDYMTNNEKELSIDVTSILNDEIYVDKEDEESSKACCNDDEENDWSESIFKKVIQDHRPFWHTNTAAIWGPAENMFCYIPQLNHRFYRFTNQPKAPGEPVKLIVNYETYLENMKHISYFK